MDSLNVGLYNLFTADATLTAGATGGVWESVAERSTAFPYLVFRLLTGGRDYTFGNHMALRRFVYSVTVYARDTATKAGRQLAAELSERAATVLLTSPLAVAGFTVMSARPTTDLAPTMERASSEDRGQHTHGHGFLCEIVLDPD